MKTLSICIPTYKRPQFLKRCIESALASAGNAPIQIIIADDSLDDTNAQVMQELMALNATIHWLRNPKNLGIDDNIQYAVDAATTDYAWLIGEDDVFLGNAIETIHTLLQTCNAPFVFANYEYVGENSTQTLGTALSVVTNSNPALVTMDRNAFIAQHLWAVGFIGACIVERSAWRTTPTEPFKGTYYTHVGRIVLMHQQLDQVSMVLTPCVANRVEGTDTFTWKKDSYGVYFGFVGMCRAVAEQVDHLRESMQRAHQVFEQRYRWLSVRLAVRLRSERGYDLAQYQKYLQTQPFSIGKKCALRLIASTPPVLLQPVVWLYRTVKRA